MHLPAKQVFCIIPARGGSKGIPGKNIRLLGGKPLLAWSVGQARQTPRVARVLVSTDSNEIAEVAREYGAEVIMRPTEISGDTASSESCLVHALDWLKTAGHRPLGTDLREPELVVFLQATSPMREPDDIQKAIETLEREQADSLFSACRVEGFLWRVDKGGTPRSFSYDHLNRPRRQDAPEDLVENGSIYIFRPWVLRQFNNRLGGKVAVYRMPSLHSFQIDEPADLELIGALMALRNSEQKADRPGLRPSISGLCKIKLLVLDFDGVLTDNRVTVTEDGKEAVTCSREDGLGVEMLKRKGMEIMVLSKEKNSVVAARCRKLGLECVQSCEDKLTVLKKRVEGKNLKADEVAYMGNDINDLECMRWVGLPIAVNDAHPDVLAAAQWTTCKTGGHGAVREVCELLINSLGHDPQPRSQ